MRRESAAVESLPVVLLLGTVLAMSALGLGSGAIIRAQSLSERQRAIESFNTFIERAHMVSAGGLGSQQLVELELADGKLVVDRNLVQLMIRGEVLRSEVMALPVVVEGGCHEIGGGSYLIELQRSLDGGYFLKVRRF